MIENLLEGKIEDQYPYCRNAVFMEEEIDRKSNGDVYKTFAKDLESGNLKSIDDVIGLIKDTTLYCIQMATILKADADKLAVAKLALPELDHPSFRDYVRAKVGMV